jgi:uncharacterized protein YutE (UPF0331/DUF86 family)
VVDREVIHARLRMLEEAVAVLEKMRDTDARLFRTDVERRYVFEHAIQRALQALLDIGSHILAEERVAIDEYREIITKLGERNVLPPPFAERISGMAGLRNLLVHQYGEVDHARLLTLVRQRLDDFREFANLIRQYLRSAD